MISKDEKIEQFKRELKSITYYEKMILEFDHDITLLDQILDSLDNDVFCLPIQMEQLNRYKNKLNFIMQQDKLIDERAFYCKKINEIIEIIDRIEVKNDKQLIVDLYINKKNYKKIASIYGYNDYSAILKHINSMLKKIL